MITVYALNKLSEEEKIKLVKKKELKVTFKFCSKCVRMTPHKDHKCTLCKK